MTVRHAISNWKIQFTNKMCYGRRDAHRDARRD